MGTLWAKSGVIEFDNNGERAPGALAYFFDAGTSTPRTVYQDAAHSTPHEHPVEADGNGRWPAVFLQFGSYKESRTTSGGSAIGSTVDNIPNPEPFDETFELDTTTTLNTGDIWFSLKNGTRDGAVRLNGRTLGNAASGATERANADTSALFTFLWDNLANAQAAVSGGRGASAAADYAANKTITLPDMRGAGPIGFDDMGNSAASRLGSAPVVSGGPTTTGSTLGASANTHTLSSSEIPSHTHSFAASTSSDGSHSHTALSNGLHNHTFTTASGGGHTHTLSGYGNASDIVEGAGVGVFSGGTGSVGTTSDGAHTHTGTVDNDGAHTHGTDVVAAHTHTVSGTSGSAGSGSAHNLLGRSMVGTWFIKL